MPWSISKGGSVYAVKKRGKGRKKKYRTKKAAKAAAKRRGRR